MDSAQIIKFLKDHPLISQRALETQVSMPQATLRHSMSGTRKIPQKYIPGICDVLRQYGFTAENIKIK